MSEGTREKSISEKTPFKMPLFTWFSLLSCLCVCSFTISTGWSRIQKSEEEIVRIHARVEKMELDRMQLARIEERLAMLQRQVDFAISTNRFPPQP